MERTTFSRVSAALISVLCCVATVAADVLDRDAWSLVLPVNRWEILVLWNGELVAADADGGLFLVDPTSDVPRTLSTRDKLPSNRVTAAVVDEFGSLWIGTSDGGAARISSDGSVRLISGLVDLDVTSLAADGNTVVYGTPNGAGIIVDGATGLPITTDDGLLSNDVRALGAYEGLVWFGHLTGVTRFDRQANSFTIANDGLNTAEQLRINAFDTSEAGIVCATAGGAFKFDENNMEWVRLGSGLNGFLRSIRRLGSSWFAVKSNDTVHELADGITGWVQLPDIDRDALDVFDVAFDTTGELWFAGTVRDATAMDGGLSAQLWAPATGASYVRDGVSRAWVQGITADGDGGYWVGNAAPNGILTHVHADGRTVSYDRAESSGDDGLCGGSLKIEVIRGSNGDIWTSAYSECVSRIRPHSSDDPLLAEYETFDAFGGDPLQSRFVDRADEDDRGRIWFVSDGTGTDSFLNQGVDVLVDPSDPSSASSWLKLAPVNSELARETVRDVAAAANGVVWFALEGFGLQRWDTDGIQDDGSLDTINDPRFWTVVDGAALGGAFDLRSPRALAIDPDGSIWVGTSDEGVIHFSFDGFPRAVEGFQQAGLDGGMLSNTISDLLVDKRGDTWVASDAGLNRIRRKGSLTEIDAWTTLNAYETRELAVRGFRADTLSPLPSASCNRLDYDSTHDRVYLSTSGGAVQLEAGDLVPPARDGMDLLVYPNPARRARVDIFVSGFDGIAEARVYDLQGIPITEWRKVRAGVDRIWDLTDLRDIPVASGMYIVQLRQSGRTAQAVLAVER